jgi:co-chaperonin GroES (HSP10)|tara:strand:+ start:375 stop:635 length:261 start_codon:yes stop_codon:yes gene_type:complete
MKAVGRNLIIKKEKVGTAKTKGGLLLAEKQREDIRYILADVKSVGDEVAGVKPKDKIYYDKHAGHGIEFEGEKYQVIKIQDVVVVL